MTEPTQVTPLPLPIYDLLAGDAPDQTVVTGLMGPTADLQALAGEAPVSVPEIDITDKISEWAFFTLKAASLQAEIEAEMKRLQTTLIVNGVKVTYNKPRRKFDYVKAVDSAWAAAVDAGDTAMDSFFQTLVKTHSQVVVDYKSVATGAKLEVPFELGDPTVSFKFLNEE